MSATAAAAGAGVPYKLIPHPTDNKLAPVGIEIAGWRIHTHKSVLSNSTEIDRYHASAGVKPPEMVFLDNSLTLEHSASGLEFVFSARDALARCKNANAANAAPAGTGTAVSASDAATAATNTNGSAAAASATTASAPAATAATASNSTIKVKAATSWTNKNMSEVDLGYDWTYTTDYKGSVRTLATCSTPSYGAPASTSLDLDLDMLKRTDVPILWNDEIILFEDELHDNGISKLTVKIRVMPTCFLVLQRFWLRVDSVLLRIRDTRLFHAFVRPKEVIRDYSEREATFEVLRRRGLPDTPKYYSDPQQFAQYIPVQPSAALKQLIALPPPPAKPTATAATAATATAAAK